MSNSIEVDVAIIKTKQEALEKITDKQDSVINETVHKVVEIDKKVVRLATLISLGTSIGTALVIYIFKDFIAK